MSNRTKRLAMLAGAFVLVCAIGWNLISMRTGAASWKSEASAWSSTTVSVASPAASLQTGAEDELPRLDVWAYTAVGGRSICGSWGTEQRKSRERTGSVRRLDLRKWRLPVLCRRCGSARGVAP